MKTRKKEIEKAAIVGRKKGYVHAFSLAELVFVLGIIAILYMLVMPSQAGVVAQAKSLEAKSNLNQVYALEKNYFFMYSKYSTNLTEINFEQNRLVTENGQSNYRIQIIEASNSSFIAQAESVTDFDADGTFNVWTINQDKELVETVKD
ncbi:MAG: type IV pilus assembly protein PilE [Crocinitomix sp.]|jgi:type IV pilus assembly protein PilE